VSSLTLLLKTSLPGVCLSAPLVCTIYTFTSPYPCGVTADPVCSFIAVVVISLPALRGLFASKIRRTRTGGSYSGAIKGQLRRSGNISADGIGVTAGSVTNPNPDLELTRDPPAPVLYWQPTQLPSYFRVHLDLVMTQQDLYLLTLFLWILFSD